MREIDHSSSEVLSRTSFHLAALYAIDVVGALFTNGSCGGKRSGQTSTLKMPQEGQVVLVAGFASEHGVVSVTPAFTLRGKSLPPHTYTCIYRMGFGIPPR